MTITQLVARGTSRLLAGIFAAKALDFALYLLLARELGVEQFGRHTFALSFTLLFSTLTDVGSTTWFTREAARAPHRVPELLRVVLRVKALLAALTVAATLGITWATDAPARTAALVAVFTAGLLLNSSAALFENLLKAAGRAGQAGLTVVAQGATTLAIGAALLFGGVGLVSGAAAYLAGAIVHLVAAAWWSRAVWRGEGAAAIANADPEARGAMVTDLEAAETEAHALEPTSATDRRPGAAAPAPLGVRAMLRESAPLALSGVFIAIYFRMDSVLLNVFQGPAAVGLYGSVYRFFEAMVLVSAAYRSVLFPVMARRADGPAEALGVLCRKTFRIHLIFTVGVAVWFTMQAQEVVALVLGPQYLPAAPALAILMWALPGAFMADTLLHLLTAQRRQVESARAVAITAIFNVALNFVLIPRYSIVGAAVATVASEVLCFALMFAAFRRTVPGLGLARAIRAPVLAGGAAALAMSALGPMSPDGAYGLLTTGFLGALVYLITLILLGAVGREDAELVHEMLPVRKDEQRRAS